MLDIQHLSFAVTNEAAGKEILHDITLTVDSGRFVVITGPNGGGKSTLAKMIAGIEKPTAGKILLDGTDMTDLSITDRAKLGVSYAFQQPVRFKGITVLDLLRIASGKRLSVSEACAILSEVGLCARDYVNREVNGSLSGGELKRIEIATVLTRGTQLSVFDEPEAGIDLWSFQNLISVFERMRQVRSDRTILVISHQERILNIADEIIVLAEGKSSATAAARKFCRRCWARRPPSARAHNWKDHREGGQLLMSEKITAVQRRLLEEVADLHGVPEGAYNIRANGHLASRQTTANISIESKTDVSGIDIRIKPGTVNESVHIPVVLSESGLKEMVYNDFYIGEGSDVLIVAGCGIDNCGSQDSQHDGLHRFFVEKNAHVRYVEKHYGSGDGTGKRLLNPGTEVHLAQGSSMEMEMVQIRGVDSTIRTTTAELEAGARLVVRERLMTHGDQKAESIYVVTMKGAGSSADVVSRSVAKDNSWQKFDSRLVGQAACSGHTECDAIIMDHAKILAVPQLEADDLDAALIHEAAIGKIAGEQIIKLMTLGLTEQEAEEQIISGFLK